LWLCSGGQESGEESSEGVEVEDDLGAVKVEQKEVGVEVEEVAKVTVKRERESGRQRWRETLWLCSGDYEFAALLCGQSRVW
jgi:hypothetical protein